MKITKTVIITSLIIFANVYGFANEFMQYKVLEHPDAGVYFYALSPENQVVGFHREKGAFIWKDQDDDLIMDEDEFRYSSVNDLSITTAAINEHGDVIISSSYNHLAFNSYAYFWNNDEKIELYSRNWVNVSLNERGEIAIVANGFVGHTTTYKIAYVSFFNENYHFRIPLLGGYGYDTLQPENEAMDINNNRIVVGWSNTGPRVNPTPGNYNTDIGPKHAIIWKDFNLNYKAEYEELIDLGSQLPGNESQARSINDHNVIVGNYGSTPFKFDDRNGNFTIDEGELTNLPIPEGSTYAYANEINNNGLIGGVADDGKTIKSTIAIIWNNDNTVIDLNKCVPEKNKGSLPGVKNISNHNWIMCSDEYGSPGIILIPQQSNIQAFEPYQ